MAVEIWKPVKGYEGLYEVSNLGRVKSIKRLHTKERILSPFLNHRGYKRVNLWKKNKSYKFSIHRLVADAFIPNPENKPEVNHIDENKINNRVDNLEWCTRKENVNHGTAIERTAKAQRNNPKTSKPVRAYDDTGSVVYEFPSIYEASRQMKVSANAITSAIKGKNRAKHCCGYTWVFVKGGAYGGD